MDFAKAFDSVPHRRLVYKLEYYGKMISSSGSRLGYLGEHKKSSSMMLTQTLPLCCLVSPRVPYVLGPILFLIFTNDLPDNINSTVCLFDDCVLLMTVSFFRNIRRSEDQQMLQDDLNILAQWEEA